MCIRDRAGEVAEDVVNLIAGNTEPNLVVEQATRTAEVARAMTKQPEEESGEPLPYLGTSPTHLKD